MLDGFTNKMAYSKTRLCRCVLPLLIAWAVTGLEARTQTLEKCPQNTALTLPQVLAEIRSGASDDKVASLISSCHVGFSIDIATLDILSSVGPSSTVMDAVDRDAFSQVTLEQARSDVDAFEKYISDCHAGLVSSPGTALARLETEYQAKRAQTARIDPKGEFEKTAEYQERLRQSQTALVALDQEHSAELAKYTGLFADRILYLKQTPYPIRGEPVYLSYDADSERLIVQLQGKEYSFASVTPENARYLKGNWNNVKMGRHYEDNRVRVLFLRDSSVSIEVELRETSEAVERQQAALEQAQRAAGEWADRANRLMWTLKDSGSRLTWQGARDYCLSLRTGGFSDWKLPATDELETIVDHSSPGGIKGGIILTIIPYIPVTSVWTGNFILGPVKRGPSGWEDDPDPFAESQESFSGAVRGPLEWQFTFPGGRSPSQGNVPAICNRRYEPPKE